jgi:serine/threonine protein kinase
MTPMRRSVISDMLKLCELATVTELANFCDTQGKRVIDVASVVNRDELGSYLYFLGRYAFKSLRPEHISETCVLMIAEDSHTSDLVAIKFIKHLDNYIQEKESRAVGRVEDSRYVIPLLASYNGEEDSAFNDELLRKGFAGYKYCIILQAADRNLQRIVNQEKIAGKEWDVVKKIFGDVVKCVEYIHSKGVIHGDLKPLNIMRSNEGKMALDLSRNVSLHSSQSPSTVCIKSPIEYENQRLSGSQPPFTQVKPSPQADMWPLGAILYYLCTGETLFLNNDSDNADNESLLQLYEWTDAIKDKKLSKIYDDIARNLVSRLLSKDPKKRPLTDTGI